MSNISCDVFPCPMCLKTFETARKYLAHINLFHSNEYNFSVICGVDGCLKTFERFPSFRSHLYRNHKDIFVINKFSKINIACKTCQNNFLVHKDFVSHLKVHFANGDDVVCPFKNCEQHFINCSTYRSHVSRYHKHDYEKNQKNQLEESPVSSCDLASIPLPDREETSEFSDILKRHVALLMLKFQELHTLPQASVQKVMEDFSSLWELQIDYFLSEINRLGQCFPSDDSSKIVNKILEIISLNHFTSTLKSLSSKFKRHTYYSSNFQFIKPVKCFLGYNDKQQPRYFHYVPLLETLKFLLNQDDVLSQILNPKKNKNSEFLCDFSDGNFYKKHPIFSTDKHALQIFLFSDEFEVCNPLGVHRKTHKILAFYYILGNIYPEYRSSTQVIQLALLSKSIDAKHFNVDNIVKPLVNDLTILCTEGIIVNSIKFKGALAFISGDNLGSNMVGGFNESFSVNVNSYCRSCLCNKSEIQLLFNDDNCIMRTPENYNEQVLEVVNDPSKSTLYGIKSNSPFNSAWFHVTEGLPPDISHDLFEGIVPYEFSLILKALLENTDSLFLEGINKKIETWPYGALDILDKPLSLSENLKIKQTAARMWTLIRLFPLMFHLSVPEDNIYWRLLLDLKELVELICSPSFHIDNVAYLKSRIEDHLQFFKELFPDARLRPKHHFLTHYASHIINFGPLKRCWTIRFEAKHYYLKKLATIGKNFKQITGTLTERHQLYQSFCASSTNGFLKHNVSVGTEKVISLQELPVKLQSKLGDEGLQGDLRTYSFLKINSIKYTPNSYLVTDIVDDEPVFSKIIYIMNKGSSFHFIVEKMCCYYVAHAGAFLITSKHGVEYDILNMSLLLDNYPLTVYVVDGKSFVSLKYLVVKNCN